MDGSSNQVIRPHDPVTGYFLPANTEYRAKKDRIAARTEALRAEYDDSPANMLILNLVAQFLDEAERGRTAMTRTRAANAARRMLCSIPRKPAPKRPANAREWYKNAEKRA